MLTRNRVVWALIVGVLALTGIGLAGEDPPHPDPEKCCVPPVLKIVGPATGGCDSNCAVGNSCFTGVKCGSFQVQSGGNCVVLVAVGCPTVTGSPTQPRPAFTCTAEPCEVSQDPVQFGTKCNLTGAGMCDGQNGNPNQTQDLSSVCFGNPCP